MVAKMPRRCSSFVWRRALFPFIFLYSFFFYLSIYPASLSFSLLSSSSSSFSSSSSSSSLLPFPAHRVATNDQFQKREERNIPLQLGKMKNRFGTAFYARFITQRFRTATLGDPHCRTKKNCLGTGVGPRRRTGRC